MCNKLFIVGIGPGNPEYVYPAAQRVIDASDVLMGGRRNLELFRHLNKEELVIGSRLQEIERYILENIGKKAMTVLASGDPGIFSITGFLKSRLGNIEMEVFPGISSLQYLCAKINKSWEDSRILSLHGREGADIADAVEKYRKVAVFTGGASSPVGVCRELLARGMGHVRVTVGEKLSYPEERIVEGLPEDICRLEFDTLSIMLLESAGNTARPVPAWDYETGGIPDEMFIRGEVPMTKEEVRAVTLARLRLRGDSVVYDIGAGTGSVSVECGLKAKSGRVYAVEKEQDAVELIKRNIERFGLRNVTVVEGEAPEVLEGLPQPDRIFIGGSGGSMEGILDRISRIEGTGLRVVINAVVLETACEAMKILGAKGFRDIDIVNIAVSRGRPVGGRHMLQALNPVYIISAER